METLSCFLFKFCFCFEAGGPGLGLIFFVLRLFGPRLGIRNFLFRGCWSSFKVCFFVSRFIKLGSLEALGLRGAIQIIYFIARLVVLV